MDSKAKEYTILSFKASDFVDDHNNTWCDILFEEAKTEPVKIVVKDPGKFSEGDKLYGEVKQVESRAGKMYWRFYRKERPQEDALNSRAENKPDDEYWEKKNQTIRAQWALGQSVGVFGDDLDNVLEYATKLFKLVDRVIEDANRPSLKEKFDEVKAKKEEVQTFEDGRPVTDEVVTEMPDEIDEDFLKDIPF
jgi:hypothetical protein